MMAMSDPATANGREDDEYSDENIKEWLEEDKLENLNPDLAEWLMAQLRE